MRFRLPTYVILMAGTNDATAKHSEIILVEILKLKSFIENELPECKVFISCPTYRFDDSKASLTLLHLRKKVSNLKLDVVMNDNIVAKHIGQKGLHLNGLHLMVQAGLQ